MLHHILFLDIETVPQYPAFSELPEEWKQLWSSKASLLIKNPELDSAVSLYERAGLYAEFGKIICISCGVISGHGAQKKILLKSFYGDQEQDLLRTFCDMLVKWSYEGNRFLCAHNGKEFDFPYLCRRMVIQHVPIPPILKTAGKKPWELPYLDTLELWKFGEYRNFTSLNLLARTLDIATPKDDIDGSRVAETYWQHQDLPRIVRYCQKDVVTVAQVYLQLNGESLISPENIEIK